MKILFIGGTGVISSACSQAVVDAGMELFLLNRGQSHRKPVRGSQSIQADINDIDRINRLLESEHFDAVVDWIAYTEEHVKRDFEFFRNKTDQYIFISSASAYAKPPPCPIRETHPLDNPFWLYSRNKILCEQFLARKYQDDTFPVTIVRPSHTYDETKIPLHGGITTFWRLVQGREVIIHGDGTTLWTLTHHRDFAEGFLGLLGNEQAIGETYHITSDEALTWDQICHLLADAAGVEAHITHVPSDVIARFDSEWADGLLGDKAYSMVFDNSKIKKLNPAYHPSIPFAEGAKEIAAWAGKALQNQNIDQALNRTMDRLASAVKAIKR